MPARRPRSSRRSRRLPALLPAIVVLVVAGACGGAATGTASARPGTDAPDAATPGAPTTVPEGPTGSGAGRAIDPCALLTDAQIEATTGFPALSHERVGGDGLGTPGCRWELDSGTPGLTWGISLDVVDPGGRRYYDAFVVNDETFTPLPELGAAAGINELGIINAVDADTLVTLYYTQVPAPDPDPTIPLVKAVLDNVRALPMS